MRFYSFDFRFCQDVDGNELQIRSGSSRSEKPQESSEKTGRKNQGLRVISTSMKPINEIEYTVSRHDYVKAACIVSLLNAKKRYSFYYPVPMIIV